MPCESSVATCGDPPPPPTHPTNESSIYVSESRSITPSPHLVNHCTSLCETRTHNKRTMATRRAADTHEHAKTHTHICKRCGLTKRGGNWCTYGSAEKAIGVRAHRSSASKASGAELTCKTHPHLTNNGLATIMFLSRLAALAMIFETLSLGERRSQVQSSSCAQVCRFCHC